VVWVVIARVIVICEPEDLCQCGLLFHEIVRCCSLTSRTKLLRVVVEWPID